MDLAAFIRDVPDFPKPGIMFKDITPLLAAPHAFTHAIDAMTIWCRARKVDAIAAAEARGFLFAAPLAIRLGVPLIPLRKPGKLPYLTTKVDYDLEYGTNSLHMHVDAISARQQVLLVDDLLATGGTMAAAAELIQKAGGQVAGFLFAIELSFLGGRARLGKHPVHSLLTY
ncbi:MAG: adenine phosphoribosyltransferase [Planctomycetota bacterium]